MLQTFRVRLVLPGLRVRCPARTSIIPVVMLAASVLLAGCAGTKKSSSITPANEVALAQSLMDEGDYRGAVAALTQFLAVHPGSRLVDEATHLLGRAYYEDGLYYEAEERFRRVIREFPESPWAQDSAYYLGLAILSQSRKPELDQSETLAAIVEFQSFISRYPDSELVPRARQHILNARTKLAEKSYKNAITYTKIKSWRAAYHELEGVVTTYPETEWVCPAMAKMVEVAVKREDWPRAGRWSQRVILESPDCPFVEKAQEHLARAEEEMTRLGLPRDEIEQIINGTLPDSADAAVEP